MPTFKDLKIYQESIRLMLEVHTLCKKLPSQEKFQLIDQFYDARKESGETQNHIFKMERKGYINNVSSQQFFDDYQKLIRGINGYINYLKRRRGDERV